MKHNSESYLITAEELIKKHRISEAILWLENHLWSYPEDIEALNLMGVCNYRLCKFEEAKEYWLKSYSLDSIDNKALFYLKSMESEEFHQLAAHYNASVDYIHLGNWGEAIVELKCLLDNKEGLIAPYSIIALCYKELGEYKKARQFINKALSMDKDNNTFKNYAIDIKGDRVIHKNYNLLGKLTLVAAILVAASAVLYGGYKLYERRAYTIKGQLDKSIEQQERQKEIVKALEEENRKLKESNEQKNNVAITDTNSREELIKLPQGKSENLLLKDALLYLKQGNYEKASQLLKALTVQGRDNSVVEEATYFLALTMEVWKLPVEAGVNYEKYIDNYKGGNYYEEALYNYGMMLYREGKIQEAKTVLLKLSKEAPNSMYVNSRVKNIIAQ